MAIIVYACGLGNPFPSLSIRSAAFETATVKTNSQMLSLLSLKMHCFLPFWHFQKVFEEFDRDKNGTFNSYELRQALNSSGDLMLAFCDNNSQNTVTTDDSLVFKQRTGSGITRSMYKTTCTTAVCHGACGDSCDHMLPPYIKLEFLVVS